MDLTEVAKVQGKAVASVFTEPKSAAKKAAVQVPIVLHDVLTANREAVEIGLGELGTRLRAFAAKIDFEHPDLADLIPTDVAVSVSQLLKLCGHAVSNKMFAALPYLSKSLNKELKENFRGIDDPFRNCQFVRLLKKPADRQTAREVKQIRNTDLQSTYRKPDWRNVNNCFSMYVRFSTLSKEEQACYERMMVHYNRMGLKSCYEEISKSIEEFKPNRAEDYYGFHRMPMTNSALVLAKVHGFDFSGPQIVVSRKLAARWSFEGQSSRASSNYAYAPRVYPFHTLASVAPAFTEKVVQHLENFPDIGFKSAFDHYLVVVPGFIYSPFHKVAHPGFYKPDGSINTCDSVEDAYKQLDMELIKSQDITPILLGERDGKCYFLCYFA